MKTQFIIVKDGKRTNTTYECEEMAKEFCLKYPEYTIELQKLIEAKKKRAVKPKSCESINYPNAQEVEAYGLECGYKINIEACLRCYTWDGPIWKDKDGKVVKNWKQKLHSVWFKPECKIQIGNTDKQVPLFACLLKESSRIFIMPEKSCCLYADIIKKSSVTAKGIYQEYAKRGKSFSMTSDEYSKMLRL